MNKRMRHLAELLRARKPIPDRLADSIAKAIEQAEREADSTSDRMKEKLTDDKLALILGRSLLGSTRPAGRPNVLTPNDAAITRSFEVHEDRGASNTETAKYLARTQGVSETTAHNKLREYDEERRKEWKELSGEA